MTINRKIVSAFSLAAVTLVACGAHPDLTAYREGRSAGLVLQGESGHSTQSIGATCAAERAEHGFTGSQSQAYVFGCTMTASGAPDLSSLFDPNASERVVRKQAQSLKRILEKRNAPDVSSRCLALAYLSLDVTDESALGNTSWGPDQGRKQHRIFAEECLS